MYQHWTKVMVHFYQMKNLPYLMKFICSNISSKTYFFMFYVRILLWNSYFVVLNLGQVVLGRISEVLTKNSDFERNHSLILKYLFVIIDFFKTWYFFRLELNLIKMEIKLIEKISWINKNDSNRWNLESILTSLTVNFQDEIEFDSHFFSLSRFDLNFLSDCYIVDILSSSVSSEENLKMIKNFC